MESICGADCSNCEYGKNSGCKGCKATNGCPFGKQCFIAKIILETGKENYEEFKNNLIEEINQLGVVNMLRIQSLIPLNGGFVNMEYSLPNGQKVKFLNDDEIYLGTQVECEKEKKCFGIVANEKMILICQYEENGENPEIVLYKKR